MLSSGQGFAVQFEPEFDNVFQSPAAYRFTQLGLILYLIHSVTLKSQSFAFGSKLLTHTTPTMSRGVSFANPFSCIEFSFCHKNTSCLSTRFNCVFDQWSMYENLVTINQLRFGRNPGYPLTI